MWDSTMAVHIFVRKGRRYMYVCTRIRNVVTSATCTAFRQLFVAYMYSAGKHICRSVPF